ncbi:MAG: ribonuclease HII, partial [Candidatus Methanospirareceae archaeon]
MREEVIREVGIDEAGKGPVIGPMVVAGVLNFEGLEELGVRDSKKLSASKREYLAKKIKEATKCVVLELSAAEIDALREKFTMNEIITELYSEVLRRLRPDRAYVDSVDVDPERFANNLKKRYGGDIEIISEHKADEKYILVSAA